MGLKLSEVTKEFYDNQTSVWPEDSYWYKYTTSLITEYVYKEYIKINKNNSNPVILNAGSGGNTYGIPSEMWHVDISKSKIENFKFHEVCSVENMPFDNNYFDLCICVGSVINYCDAINVIKELVRCLKPCGKLILEFESSVTGELFFNKKFGQNIVLFDSNYLNSNHIQWLYNPKLIINIMRKYNGNLLDIRRFHIMSSIMLALQNEEKAYKLSKFDNIAKFIPILRNISSNVIITFSKRN